LIVVPADDEPEPAEISRIAERHGVAPTAVTKIESGGEANHVYFLGDQLVLRIARHHPDFIADLTKEALIIPGYVRSGCGPRRSWSSTTAARSPRRPIW
jgi:hypothetical protein